ncbi:MAG: hypothetical protein R3E31_17040 [Chloroflexota bacterium]|nr:hypothetical protein [Anaerolineales bacterium]MCA9976301.1 hypothetical protein [Anaerolineales bacterium]
MSEVTITIDERGRLVTAVLAASHWPQQEQAELTHAVHPHAKQTRHFVEAFQDHAAVQGVNALLASGTAVDDLFAAAFCCNWPDMTPQEPLPAGISVEWTAALADFGRKTAVPSFWAEHEAMWHEALTDLEAICQYSRLPAFIERLTGRPLHKNLTAMPNLVYPALHSILAETVYSLYLLLPPPKAVGESPPWPYREGPDWVLAEACHRLVAYSLATVFAQAGPAREQLITRAAITLFLEEALGDAEAMSYMVRCKRQFKLPALPMAVDELREFMQGNGRSLFDLSIP